MLEDRLLLKDLLQLEKGLAKSYCLAKLESSTQSMKQRFTNLENTVQNQQFQVFEVMHKKGFYPTPPAQAQEIGTTQQTWQQRLKNLGV